MAISGVRIAEDLARARRESLLLFSPWDFAIISDLEMQSGGVPSGTRCTVAHTHVYYSGCYLNYCVQKYRSRRLSCTL